MQERSVHAVGKENSRLRRSHRHLDGITLRSAVVDHNAHRLLSGDFKRRLSVDLFRAIDIDDIEQRNGRSPDQHAGASQAGGQRNLVEAGNAVHIVREVDAENGDQLAG